MKILVLGASFTGEYLADHFPDHEVWFLSRRSAELSAAGRRVYPPQSTSPETPAGFDAILDTVPAVPAAASGSSAEPVAIQEPPYHAEVMQLLAHDPNLPYIHVSSTSVLPGSERGAVRAQSAGAGPAGAPRRNAEHEPPALDESAPVGPENERGARRLRLEERIRELYPRAGILRSTGIYGPGRSIALQFREGNFRRTASGNIYVSRIHVHDLARLFLAMAERLRANPGDAAARLVHAVDERPTANREVFTFLEEELSLAIPGDWRTEPPRGRIIRSRHAAELLGGRYRFPTYVEGFRACLAL